MRPQPAFALMAGVGTGKSWMALNDAHDVGADVVVVVAPSGVHESTWAREEIPKHWSGPEPLVGVTRSGRKDYGLRELLQTPHAAVRIACVNYEALSSLHGLEAVASLLRKAKHPTLILDESHNIKTPTSRRTKVSWKLAALAARRRILSGTMTTRGYEDLYAQFRFLNPNIIGVPTFTAFKSAFCEMVTGHAGGNTHTFQKINGYKNLKELFRRIAPFVYQVHKDECLDLPQQTWMTRTVALSEEQQHHYNELAKYSLTMAASGAVVTAEQAITQILRMQQVVSGHLATGPNSWVPLACPRIQACVDVAAQSDGKVLVWARFIPNRTRLLDAFQKADIGALEYTDDASLQRFKQDPERKVLILSPAKGAAGLTINEAPNAIHYSLSFKWVDLEQSEGRNHRSGQLVPVSYTNLLTPGTTDEHLLQTLRARQDVADTVRGAPELGRWVRPIKGS